MQNNLLIKYIKKKNPKGMDMLIDNYGGIIASVVRKHLGTGKVLMDMIRIKTPLKIGYVPLLNINQLITEKSI